ncbi:MAG: hypothetical protein EOO91_10035 [Pedobacter sp.]|nr:MAG: hypothetical protein EOO91_10035 [Pedobacter sp.]
METVKVNTSQHVDIDYPVAGLGERVGARLIDLALLIFVLIAFMIIFSMTGVLSGNELTTIVLISIYGAGFVFYDLLCEIFMNGQRTYNADLIYQMASKVSNLISITIPEGMNELDFLKTIITDYSHITSRAV